MPEDIILLSIYYNASEKFRRFFLMKIHFIKTEQEHTLALKTDKEDTLI